MRDLVLSGFIFCLLPMALWRPWVGVMLWVWISVMNPHKLAYGFAFNFPFAQIIAITTLIGFVVTRDPKKFPVNGLTTMLILMTVWMNLSMIMPLEFEKSIPVWEQVMKTMVMLFIGMALLHTRRHLDMLVWILVLSIGFYSFKGGIFTVLTGGQWRVYGPSGGVIEENNALAVATIMAIPLMRYLQLQAKNKWVRRGLLLLMAVSAISALGSQSRGGLLAISAMGLFFWWKSRHKFLLGIGIAIIVAAGLAVMSERWEARMATIKTYEQDESAVSRLVAWGTMVNIALDNPFVGGGFHVSTPQVYARYSADPSKDYNPVAHSIYFQMLGSHGFVGLFLFVGVGFAAWRTATRMMKAARGDPDCRWAYDLGGNVQVSLIGYGVGGAFLSLQYWDMPYYILAALVLANTLMREQLRAKAPAPKATRRGMQPPAAVGRA
jgi:putative inorganic carbon (HCO3(-)) transporter